MSPRFRSDDMLGGGYGAAPATSYTATKTAPPRGIMHDGIVCRGPARRRARQGLHRCVKQLGVGPPRRAARRGPATCYISTSAVPPDIIHDGIARRGPARRHALRRLHRGVKQLGVGPTRGVQLGVVGLHRGLEQLGVGAHRGVHSAWGRTVAYISLVWGDSMRGAVLEG